MRTLYGFEELGNFFGITKRPKREKDFYCKACGGKMKRINNVLICENMVEVEEDGKKVTKPCGNRVIMRVRRAESSLIAPG